MLPQQRTTSRALILNIFALTGQRLLHPKLLDPWPRAFASISTSQLARSLGRNCAVSSGPLVATGYCFVLTASACLTFAQLWKWTTGRLYIRRMAAWWI